MPTPTDGCFGNPCNCIRNSNRFCETWAAHRNDLTMEEIHRLTLTEFVRLKCLAANGPSSWRNYAKTLLRHRVFNLYWELYP